MRLFVGVPAAPDVAAALAALPRPDVPAVRWTGSEQWHVTLRFLGEVADEAVDDLVAALGAVGDVQGPSRAVVGPATRRLGRGVLVVPVGGLDDLAAAVVAATAGFGVPPDDRPFTGHLTIARGKGRRPVPASLAGEPVEGAFTVEGVELVRSRLGAGGARYETVATVSLDGPVASAGR